MKKKANGVNGAIHFRVEAGVPLPQINQGAARKYDWPFNTMKVGEHFMFPIEGDGGRAIDQARQIVIRSAREYRVLGKRFSTRLMPDDRHIGVWRIA